MTQYFKLTPITEKPEKEGEYYVLFNHTPSGVFFKNYWSPLLGWNDLTPEGCEWLKPLPSSSLVIEEEKLRDKIVQAFNNGSVAQNRGTSLLDREIHIDAFINQLISDLKEQHG